MSAQTARSDRNQISAPVGSVEQSDDLLSHLPCLVSGHGNKHFRAFTSRGEANVIASQFGNRLVQERANSLHSIRHVFLPFPPKGKGETAQVLDAPQLTGVVNSVIISTPEATANTRGRAA